DFFLKNLADRVYDLKDCRPRNEDEREVSEIVLGSERAGQLYRRRQLPIGFTGGPVVYAADLIIRPRDLRHGRFTDRDKRLPVVAEPGASGAIEHLPYWDATGETAPKENEPTEVLPVDTPPAAVATPADDWIDVTEAVLGEPEEIPVVSVVGTSPRARK